MAQVILKNIYKSFADRQKNQDPTQILQGINLTIEDGEFMVLVGPSGCGKSTLLRLVAGLETLTAGEIWLGDRLINHLPPKNRDMAMVFQNYALYPHLNVYDNLAFGLRRILETQDKTTQIKEEILTNTTRFLPKKLRFISNKEKIIREKVYRSAQLLQIESLLNRLPKELSGGQKQRVALGRAISRAPQVFLMDEPLSNLDAKLRADTRTQIVQLQRQLNTTTLYVTHDQTEAMTMGDRIAVMEKGQILQIASPLEIYHKPVNRFVAQFIGSPPMNFLEAIVEGNILRINQEISIKIKPEMVQQLAPYQNQGILLGIRPENFQITDQNHCHFSGIIEAVEALGNETFLSVSLEKEPTTKLKMRMAPNYLFKTGELINLAIDLEKIHYFDLTTEKRIDKG